MCNKNILKPQPRLSACLSHILSHCYKTDFGSPLLQQLPRITLLQRCPWIPLLHFLFPWLSTWRHHPWSAVNNTFGILFYSKDYEFPLILSSSSSSSRVFFTQEDCKFQLTLRCLIISREFLLDSCTVSTCRPAPSFECTWCFIFRPEVCFPRNFGTWLRGYMGSQPRKTAASITCDVRTLAPCQFTVQARLVAFRSRRPRAIGRPTVGLSNGVWGTSDWYDGINIVAVIVWNISAIKVTAIKIQMLKYI
jgi:hypothetical protein